MKGIRVVRSVFVCLIALAGCASNGREDVVAVGVSDQEYEARLREHVEAEIARGRARQGEGSAQLLFSKPYYYKEYWEYAAESPVFSADYTEKESRTVPMTADVEIEKIRFATRNGRNKKEVRDDRNYLRSTGIEQASYELRNGEWRRVGSLFMAERTEELRDGEWSQIEERRQVLTIDEEEPGGFWRRLMFWR